MTREEALVKADVGFCYKKWTIRGVGGTVLGTVCRGHKGWLFENASGFGVARTLREAKAAVRGWTPDMIV